MVEAGDLKSYFANARTWEQDRLLAADRSRRIAWVTAGVASLLAVVSVGAVAALTPLKTVEPFVIRVDSATGIVDVVNALDNTGETYDEAVYRPGFSGHKILLCGRPYRAECGEPFAPGLSRAAVGILL